MVSNFFLNMGISFFKNISLFEILMSYGFLKGVWLFILYL